MKNDVEISLRRFWAGKRPSVRKAVEDYLKTIGIISQQDIALKYGCNAATIRTHVMSLSEKDLLKYYVSQEMAYLVKVRRRCPTPIPRTISVRCRLCGKEWYPNPALWENTGYANGKSLYCHFCSAKNRLPKNIVDAIIADGIRNRGDKYVR